MAQIFVSYKSEDRERVRTIVDEMRRAGLSLWWDQDISPGAPWEASIARALEQSKCVIVCWTSKSVHPFEGQKVQVEAREALDSGKLIQVLLENVRPPLFFRQRQAVNLASWRGDVGDIGFQKLLQSARDISRGLLPSLDLPTRSPPARRIMLLGLSAAALAVFGVSQLFPRSADTPSISEARRDIDTSPPAGGSGGGSGNAKTGVPPSPPPPDPGPTLPARPHALDLINGRWALYDASCTRAMVLSVRGQILYLTAPDMVQAAQYQIDSATDFNIVARLGDAPVTFNLHSQGMEYSGRRFKRC